MEGVRTFTEWLYILKPQTKFMKQIKEMKHWSFESYTKDGLSFALKCNLCRMWHYDCKCF